LVDSLIDTFMTQPHRPISREKHPEVAADLLRAPPPTKQLSDQDTELFIGVDPSSVMTCSAHGSPPMSLEGLISATGRRGVAPELARDGRGRTPELVGNGAHAQPSTAQISDLNAFVLGQVASADLTYGQRIQWRDEPDHDAVSVGLMTAGPAGPGRPRYADFTGRGTDAPPAGPQLHEPLTLGRQRTTPRPLLHPTRRCQHNLQNLECCDDASKPPRNYLLTF
jgi:hypothetical protein